MPVFILVENDIGVIEEIVAFDLTSNENHETIAEVTSNPVEEGEPITDHVRVMPSTLSCEVFVTNTPIKPSLFFPERGGEYGAETFVLPVPYAERARPPVFTPGAGTRALTNVIAGRFSPAIANAVVLKFNTFDSVATTTEKLDSILKARKPVRVVTTLKEYERMVLTRVSEPVTQESAGGATFNLDFVQVRTVIAEVVTAPIDPAELRGEPQVNRGTKGATVVNEMDRPEMRKSLLKLLKDSI